MGGGVSRARGWMAWLGEAWEGGRGLALGRGQVASLLLRRGLRGSAVWLKVQRPVRSWRESSDPLSAQVTSCTLCGKQPPAAGASSSLTPAPLFLLPTQEPQRQSCSQPAPQDTLSPCVTSSGPGQQSPTGLLPCHPWVSPNASEASGPSLQALSKWPLPHSVCQRPHGAVSEVGLKPGSGGGHGQRVTENPVGQSPRLELRGPLTLSRW